MKRNISLFTIIIILALSLSITVCSLYNLRKTGIEAALHNAASIADVIKSGLTAHMINDSMHEVDTFVNSVADLENINKLWLVRSPLINNQFNKEINKPLDQLDKKVLETGKMQYSIDEAITHTLVRVTIPYNAVADKGVNCLKCHNVKHNSTLGAVSMVLDMSAIKEIGIESLYIILLLILSTVIFILLFSKKIITPYIKLYDRIKNNISLANNGKFKKLNIPDGLSQDMKSFAHEYNSLMLTFKSTSVDIDKKLHGFIGHKASSSDNPLSESKEIINNLSDLFQFKKQIELDNSKEEIYNRVAEIFINKFKLENFSFIEIDMSKQKMTKVKSVGDSLCCEKNIKESPELCRAARTKNDVMSIDYHSSCPYFEDKDRYYYCFNIDIAKNIYLIINCVSNSKEELEYIKEKTIFIKNYIAEAAPVLEVKLLMDALQESAFRDGLTGLYNRKFLDEHSKKLIPQARRENINIGVLMLDMDHFKAVNDEYGHDIGDKVLKELARILDETVRESDLVIRYGGEEFIVLLVGVNTEEDALKVANKIGSKVRENEVDVYAGTKLKKTISIGLSMFPHDGTSLDVVLKNADIALYEAKSSGRDKVVTFNEEQISSVDLF
jgi:two-component system cell cycle response regulator